MEVRNGKFNSGEAQKLNGLIYIDSKKHIHLTDKQQDMF
jgi:hypothetical protein